MPNPYMSILNKVRSLSPVKPGSDLYDSPTVLLEATMAKANQLKLIQEAASKGDKRAERLYERMNREFEEQLGLLKRVEELKTAAQEVEINKVKGTFNFIG